MSRAQTLNRPHIEGVFFQPSDHELIYEAEEDMLQAVQSPSSMRRGLWLLVLVINLILLAITVPFALRGMYGLLVLPLLFTVLALLLMRRVRVDRALGRKQVYRLTLKRSSSEVVFEVTNRLQNAQFTAGWDELADFEIHNASTDERDEFYLRIKSLDGHIRFDCNLIEEARSPVYLKESLQRLNNFMRA